MEQFRQTIFWINNPLLQNFDILPMFKDDQLEEQNFKLALPSSDVVKIYHEFMKETKYQDEVFCWQLLLGKWFRKSSSTLPIPNMCFRNFIPTR